MPTGWKVFLEKSWSIHIKMALVGWIHWLVGGRPQTVWMVLELQEKLDAKSELLNGGPHTVFKVWAELSSGHKCQLVWRVLSELGATRTIKSLFIFPCVNRERLIVGDRKSETTGSICIKWVNMSVWKVQFVPALFTYFFFFLHQRSYTQIWDLFLATSGWNTHTNKNVNLYFSFSL